MIFRRHLEWLICDYLLDDIFVTHKAFEYNTPSTLFMTENPVSPIDPHAISQSNACRHVYMPGYAPGEASTAKLLAEDGPLAGMQVSVKDLFDVAGQTTAAG